MPGDSIPASRALLKYGSTMRTRVALVTGFEPYGGRGINPSAEVVRRVDGLQIEGAQVVGRVLPVSFAPLRASARSWRTSSPKWWWRSVYGRASP